MKLQFIMKLFTNMFWQTKTTGGMLYLHLRHQNKNYRKCSSNARNTTGILNRVNFDERPAVANDRVRILETRKVILLLAMLTKELQLPLTKGCQN